jgi:hypothetical protein
MTLNPTIPQRVAENWSISIFCWSFLTMMWNLMSRSDSVQNLMLEHLSWSEDALIVEEQGHKGDQTGSERYGKHVYANPDNPSICPILAYSVNVFCERNRQGPGSHQLYFGTDTKGRFNHNLGKLVQSFTQSEALILGCNVADIGTHSCRKGSGTYCTGYPSGPTNTTIRLRMGHSLGKMIHSSVTLLHRLCSRQNVLHSCQESDGILEKIILDNKLLKDGVNIGELSLQDSERVFFEAFNLLIPHL